MTHVSTPSTVLAVYLKLRHREDMGAPYESFWVGLNNALAFFGPGVHCLITHCLITHWLRKRHICYWGIGIRFPQAMYLAKSLRWSAVVGTQLLREKPALRGLAT